ncbi:MAG: hypothetical protein FJ091_12105 [Deltaproteobacteria bacterium]|nr:hypothetical protein [Deltaproteobacteria bacterium]
MVSSGARFVYGLAFLFAIGGAVHGCSIPSDANAVQSAAWYAQSLAIAAIPYVLARCIEKMSAPDFPTSAPPAPKAAPQREVTPGVYEIK